MNHLDIRDTSSSSELSTGAGLAIEQLPLDPLKLPKGPDALHLHLAQQFEVAEQAASLKGPSSVSSLICIDLGQVERQYQKWVQFMPRVRPYYAVKAHPDPAIIRTLLDAGAGFDCASAAEIHLVRTAGAHGADDMIFANCCKFPTDLRYARVQGVKRMTVDNTDELHKIASHFPDADVILRIVTDDSNSVCQLSNKYGAALCDVEHLLSTAADLNLNMVGVSFHVGSGTSNPCSFSQPIANAAEVFEAARAHGYEMNLLDIGGGFPGDDEGAIQFSDIAGVINNAIEQYFPQQDVHIIAEPGRFFAHASATLATKVIARRVVSAASKAETDPDVLYYLGDGVYGSFNCVLFDHYTPPPPVPLLSKPNTQLQKSRVFGPTCDGLDTIYEAIDLPMIEIGDLLVFRHMGAYTNAAASNFNGISSPHVIYTRT